MLSVGLQTKLLHGSIGMELSKDPAKKSDQIAKNQQLANESEGHLAPVNGQERIPWLHDSKLVQFFGG